MHRAAPAAACAVARLSETSTCPAQRTARGTRSHGRSILLGGRQPATSVFRRRHCASLRLRCDWRTRSGWTTSARSCRCFWTCWTAASSGSRGPSTTCRAGRSVTAASRRRTIHRSCCRATATSYSGYGRRSPACRNRRCSACSSVSAAWRSRSRPVSCSASDQSRGASRCPSRAASRCLSRAGSSLCGPDPCRR